MLLSFLYLAVRNVFALFRPKGFVNFGSACKSGHCARRTRIWHPHGRMLEPIAEARAAGTMPTKEEALELVRRCSEAGRRDG